MLKRYQVLLTSWQADYLKFIAEKYDISFSETIRAAICLATMCVVPKVYPEYKPAKITGKSKDVGKKIANVADQIGVHRLLSNLYFEARKAADYSYSKASGEKHTRKIFS